MAGQLERGEEWEVTIPVVNIVMRRRGGELQGSDEDAEDHLIEFASRLETGIKCFQRQVETTDKKVEEARRLTRTTPQSPRRKRRRKR